MILESAVLDVKAGQASDFEAAFARARPIIVASKGCLGCELRRCVENPNRYLLLVRWATLEDHTEGFRKSEAYAEWKRLLHHFYDPFPTVEHYEDVAFQSSLLAATQRGFDGASYLRNRGTETRSATVVAQSSTPAAAVEVIGIDHVYIAVRDLARSRTFYDGVMSVLGYRSLESTIGVDPHVHYYNRQFGFSLRPSRAGTPDHDPYAPGLHHVCFRVLDEAAVDRAAAELSALGIEATAPRYYPEYAADYYAIFFADPDGVRLEITNFREVRRRRMFAWDDQR